MSPRFTVKAIYEKGVLRFKEPIPLADGMEVEVTVTYRQRSVKGAKPAEVLAAIASLPLETQDGESSGRDHDSILYETE